MAKMGISGARFTKNILGQTQEKLKMKCNLEQFCEEMLSYF